MHEKIKEIAEGFQQDIPGLTQREMDIATDIFLGRSGKELRKKYVLEATRMTWILKGDQLPRVMQFVAILAAEYKISDKRLVTQVKHLSLVTLIMLMKATKFNGRNHVPDNNIRIQATKMARDEFGYEAVQELAAALAEGRSATDIAGEDRFSGLN